MTDHSSEDTEDSATPQYATAATGEQMPVLKSSDETLHSTTEGDAIAVRACKDGDETILAGTVTEVNLDNVEARIEEAIADVIDFIGNPPSAQTVPIIRLNATTRWQIKDGTLVDHSHKMENRPPYQYYRSDEPKEAPPCTVRYRDDGRIRLAIPGAVSNGKRTKQYFPADYGSVVDCISGSVVDPAQLLPSGYEPPTD